MIDTPVLCTFAAYNIDQPQNSHTHTKYISFTGKRGNKNQTPKANNNNNNNIMNTGFDTEEKKEGRATRFKKELFTVSDTISSMMESANKMGVRHC